MQVTQLNAIQATHETGPSMQLTQLCTMTTLISALFSPFTSLISPINPSKSPSSNSPPSFAQVCDPKVWHLLLLPDLQVQAGQPGFQVHRTATATSLGRYRWSRPRVHVSVVMIEDRISHTQASKSAKMSHIWRIHVKILRSQPEYPSTATLATCTLRQSQLQQKWLSGSL